MICQIFSSNPHPTSPGPDPQADAVTSWMEVLNKAPWLMCLVHGSDHTVQDHELRPPDELTVLQKAIFALLCPLRHSELTDEDGVFQIKKAYLRASREAAKIANTKVPADDLFDNKDNSAHKEEGECNEVDDIQFFTEPSRRSGRSARLKVDETSSTVTLYQNLQNVKPINSSSYKEHGEVAPVEKDKKGSAYT